MTNEETYNQEYQNLLDDFKKEHPNNDFDIKEILNYAQMLAYSIIVKKSIEEKTIHLYTTNGYTYSDETKVHDFDAFIASIGDENTCNYTKPLIAKFEQDNLIGWFVEDDKIVVLEFSLPKDGKKKVR